MPSNSSSALQGASLRTQLHPRVLIATVFSVISVWSSSFIIILSLTALVFSGRLTPHLGSGIGLALFSGMIISFVVSMTSSYSGMIGQIQNSAMAPAALLVANTVNALPADAAPDTVLYTAVVIIGLTTLATGVAFILIGSLRAGDLIRYIPYPVMGGFLAGTGWLLFEGAIDVMTGYTLSPANFPILREAEMVIRWGPGVMMAVILFGLYRKFNRSWLIPAVVIAFGGLFYGILFAADISLTEASQRGLLLGQGVEQIMWQPPDIAMLGTVDWTVITAHSSGIIAVVLVSSIHILLNASGVELVTQHDVELNHELRSAGLANVLAGSLGGMVGFSSLSLTTLAHRIGAHSRIVGLLMAALFGAALLVGIPALGYLPRAAFGGLLIYLSLTFLVEWLWDTHSRLPLADYLMMVSIFLVVILVGFLEGVALGIIAMIVLFVFNYSRIDITKHQLTGDVYHSNVDRSPKENTILAQQGVKIWVLRLQGYIFFGTSNNLLNIVRQRLRDTQQPPLSHLILDFHLVNGLDTSAIMDFVKLGQIATAQDFKIVFTALDDKYRVLLQRSGLIDPAQFRYVEDMDHGMEWCEDDLLTAVNRTAQFTIEDQFDSRSIRRTFDMTRLMGYLKRLQTNIDDRLIREGDSPDSIYIVESGRLDIVMQGQDGHEIRLRTISAGAIIGEVGFYLGTPRTASAIVRQSGTVYELTREALSRMERDDPEIANSFQILITSVLCERLTNMNHFAQALMG